MLDIKTAKEAKQDWENRAEGEVVKAIREAQEKWKTKVRFYDTHIPIEIAKQLEEMGYTVSEELDMVSWA